MNLKFLKRGLIAMFFLACPGAGAGTLSPQEVAQIENAFGIVLSEQQKSDLGTIVKPDDTAPWRQAAEERIESHRKSRLTVQVRDTAGRPVNGAEVQIKLKKNAFRFGGVVTVMDLTDASGNLAAEGSGTGTWKNITTRLFNAVGLNNGFKPKITGQHSYIPGFLDWAEANDLDVRAHLLMWPGGGHLDGEGNLGGTPGSDYGNHLSNAGTSAYASHNVLGAVETWANAAPGDRAEKENLLKDEVDSEISEWVGRWDVYEWDVINETVGNTLLQEILGWDQMAEWFRIAQNDGFRTLNPGASRYSDTDLYINDFKIISAKPTALDGGSQHAFRKGRYMERIDRVIADDGPIGGVGFQSRFRYGPVEQAEVHERIDEFARRYPDFRLAGTEFEIKDGKDYLHTEIERARMTEELLTTYYSHDQVVGLSAWDFMSASSDPDPTESTAALAWYDGTIKLNGLVWYYLHRIRYHTDVTAHTTSGGSVAVSGHRGEYEVTVRHGGKTYPASVRLSGNRTISVTVDAPFGINAGISDAWFDPATNGQGFFITVFPVVREMFLAWYTYDADRPPAGTPAQVGEPGHRWFTAQGPYEGNTADLTLYLTSGGVFNQPQPAAETDLAGAGWLHIEFNDCTMGRVSYEIDTLGLAGEIPIERIVPDKVALCQSLAQ